MTASLVERARAILACTDAPYPLWSDARQLILDMSAVIEAHDLCHDLHGKVGCKEFAAGCAAEQRRIYGSAPHADALGALARAVGNYLDHPGCNNPARATAMRKLRWAMEQAEAV